MEGSNDVTNSARMAGQKYPIFCYAARGWRILGGWGAGCILVKSTAHDEPLLQKLETKICGKQKYIRKQATGNRKTYAWESFCGVCFVDWVAGLLEPGLICVGSLFRC